MDGNGTEHHPSPGDAGESGIEHLAGELGGAGEGSDGAGQVGVTVPLACQHPADAPDAPHATDASGAPS